MAVPAVDSKTIPKQSVRFFPSLFALWPLLQNTFPSCQATARRSRRKSTAEETGTAGRNEKIKRCVGDSSPPVQGASAISIYMTARPLCTTGRGAKVVLSTGRSVHTAPNEVLKLETRPSPNVAPGALSAPAGSHWLALETLAGRRRRLEDENLLNFGWEVGRRSR